jgi:Asp-tRNA(Asn)/Glu-tRNA(Gln) amidotransferase A subunit family amidase
MSTRGSIPVRWSIDTIGMRIRTVPDATLFFSALAGPGQRTIGRPGRPPRIGVLFAAGYDRLVLDAVGHFPPREAPRRSPKRS